jgi:hypothetical protein
MLRLLAAAIASLVNSASLTTIADLNAVTSLSITDILHVNVSGVDKKITKVHADIHKNNITSSNPTVNSDSNAGYSVGSIWFNSSTSVIFICVDNTVGAAIWGSVSPNATNQMTFYIKKNAYVDTSVLQGLMGSTVTVSKVRAYATIAPDGADIEIDFNKNGVSFMNTVLTIADGANAGTSTDFSGTPSLIPGDRISIDIDQVGSTTPGGNDLMVTLEF